MRSIPLPEIMVQTMPPEFPEHWKRHAFTLEEDSSRAVLAFKDSEGNIVAEIESELLRDPEANIANLFIFRLGVTLGNWQRSDW